MKISNTFNTQLWEFHVFMCYSIYIISSFSLFFVTPPIFSTFSHIQDLIFFDYFVPYTNVDYFKCVHFNVVWSDALPYGCSKHFHAIYSSSPLALLLSFPLPHTIFPIPAFTGLALPPPFYISPLSPVFLVLWPFFFDDFSGYLRLKTQI